MKAVATATLTTALALGAWYATPASADWYAGVGAGRAEVDERAGLTEVDDDDIGWQVFAGYSLIPQLGFELGYVDLGEFSGQAGTTPFDVGITGFTFHGVVRLTLGERFAALGKVGYFLWEQDTSANGTSFDEDGFDFIGGVGLEYRFTGAVTGRLSWERYDSDADVEWLGAALLYRF